MSAPQLHHSAPGSNASQAKIFLCKHLLGSHTPPPWWPHSWPYRCPRPSLTVHKSSPLTIPQFTRRISRFLFPFFPCTISASRKLHFFWELGKCGLMLSAAVFYGCNGCREFTYVTQILNKGCRDMLWIKIQRLSSRKTSYVFGYLLYGNYLVQKKLKAYIFGSSRAY